MFKQGGYKSYYDILKISPQSSDKEIRKAYVTLANIYHPDKNSTDKKIANLRFRLINEAYAALKTSEGRKRYNKLLLASHGKPKGLRLKADNDNRVRSKTRNSFLNTITRLFTPPKNIGIHHNKISSTKEKI